MSLTEKFLREGNLKHFLEKRVVMVPPEVDVALPAVGVHRFKLVPLGSTACYLDLELDAAAEHVISAYWLPWNIAGAASMKLGDGANFFFTSELTNCRLSVLMDEPGAPLVTHITGESIPSQRNTMEAKVLGTARNIRRFSTAGVYGHGYKGYHEDPTVASSAFLFGVRAEGVWKFYAQVTSGILGAKSKVTEGIKALRYVDILNHPKTAHKTLRTLPDPPAAATSST